MMSADNDRWQRIENLFLGALDVLESERRAFVEMRSGGDATLTRDVLALVDAHTRTHPLLDSPAVTDLPAGMRLGPYALERVIGSGGMATVYLARRADRQFEKQVAVKLVNRGLTAEIIGDRFRTERQILARLEHPHIARLLDAGLNDFGQPYLVMEWVDGVTLDEWVARERPPIDRRFDLWLDVAAAVGYAHQNLVIHRDLKPSNVLVGRDGIVKLVDFGIAKLVAEQSDGGRATQTMHFTPMYASPEQIRGEPVTTATDSYALGLLLYELTIGRHPFPREGQSAHDQMQAALADEAVVPDGTPADLAAILRMALRKEPERRYPTAAAFADDVRRYRRGLPVIAQPETVAYRARKFAARHRLAVATAAIVTISLLSLTGIALWQAHVATQQRARAEEVTEYIAGFLGATPSGSDWALRDRGAGLRVVELADLMADRLDGSSDTQLETEASLRYVLGMVYFQTGEVAKLERNAARARELFGQIAALDDPRRLSAELLGAVANNALGRFAETERIMLDLRKRWRNPPVSAAAAIYSQLGQAQFRLGKTDEAERTLRSGIESLQAAIGADDRNIALISTDLALIYMERGDFDNAARQLERAAAITRAKAPGTSVALGWALVNLGYTYRNLGRLDDALRLASEANEQMARALGTTHYSLIHPLALMAYVEAIHGDTDAESTIRKGVALQNQLPADHFERAVGLTYLGFVLMHERKLPEAQRALEEALRLRRRHFKPPNWRIAETAGFLGEVLALRGDRARAESLLQESFETFTTVYGRNNPRTLDAQQRRDRHAAGRVN